MKVLTDRGWLILALAIAGNIVLSHGATAEENPYVPQAQSALRQMLTIDWAKGPSLPQGFQDSAGGIVDVMLITAGGFCQGKTVPGKESIYPRGFLTATWGLNLGRPENRWQKLPDFPGVARQGLVGLAVDGVLYCWGGFNYSAPFSYQDGYRLSRHGEEWRWQPAPDLPWPLCSYGLCAIGSKIYLLGGADYAEDYRTAADRTGKVKRLGARLLVLDVTDLIAGWKELTACPGTPRFAHALATVGGQIYVIGGATGRDNPTGKYCTVVDNWRYEPTEDSWQRLRDLPVASGNFPPGQIVACNRYVLLIGGFQYDQVLDVDGSPKPLYGKPTRYYPENAYCSDVFVYDTRTDMFGTATALPLNNNGATTVVEGNRIHLLGGETGGCEIEGEKFAHHPDLYLTGNITEAVK